MEGVRDVQGGTVRASAPGLHGGGDERARGGARVRAAPGHGAQDAGVLGASRVPSTVTVAGLVYLDASGLIYSVERVEPYRTLLEPMWQGAQDGNITIVSSPILVVETLVKPLRDGNTETEMQYRELFRANAVISPPCRSRATTVVLGSLRQRVRGADAQGGRGSGP